MGLPVRRRRPRGARDPARAHRADPRHLARGAARDPPRPALRVPGRRARGTPTPGCGSTRPSCCSTPTPCAVSGTFTSEPAGVRARPHRRREGPARGPRRPRLRGVRREGGRGPRRLRLGRRATDAAALARHRHLRAARQGLHQAARPDPRGAARDVRRARPPRGHRLPQGPRRHRGRAAARPRVRLRAAPRGARADQLLGLQLDRLLRAALGVLLLRRPWPAGHRVQADGARTCTPPASRSSSTSSTTTPPRRGPTGPTLQLPRARRPRLLPARVPRPRGPGTSRTPTGTSPAAATRSTPTTPRRCG